MSMSEAEPRSLLTIRPPRHRVRRVVLAATTASLLALTGCAAAGAAPSAGAPPLHADAAGAAGLTLVTEPDNGFSSIYALINGATKSIEMTMYELVDATAQTDLINAQTRGVKVRVILDEDLEKANNTPAYNALEKAGVDVVWANTRYRATHEKAIVVDDTTAEIMTLNLTSRYYPSTRDFAVTDTDPLMSPRSTRSSPRTSRAGR